MPSASDIEWTQWTWNPVTGCTKVSQGCKNCYAERMARRLRAMGVQRYADGFSVKLHEDLIELPLRWKSPRLIFVNSMSDLFHEAVPEEFIQKVFNVMEASSWHTFQVLTKRSSRLRELSSRLPWPQNVWMGVSVEDDRVLHRLEDLREVPAYVRFLSCEPLIGPLPDLDLSGIHWLIAGGESGPGSRPMEQEWVKDLQNQCVNAGVAFFFKQWGGVRKHLTGRVLDGRTFDELPSKCSHEMEH